MKKLTCFYLHADLHAVAVYETYHAPSNTRLEYVEIYEKFIDRKFYAMFNGRIVFHQYNTAIVDVIKKMATGIRCDEPAVDRGSENTKRLNLKLGHIHINTPKGDISFDLLPDLISSGFTYQPDIVEKFDPSMTTYCGANVAKIHYANKESVAS